MNLGSFLTSLATSFVIFLVLILLFTWLSGNPRNEEVYYPSRILRGLEPREGKKKKRRRNPFAWIGEAISASEADIIAAAGLDTAVYLIFLFSRILLFSGIVLLPLFLPVAATDHAFKPSGENKSNETFNLDNLAMGNIHERSPRLWAFLLATYWVSLVSFHVLWKACKHVSDLRASVKSSSSARPEDFAVLIRDIPFPSKNQTIEELVESYFKTLHRDTFYKSIVVTDNTQVSKIYDELEGYRKKLAHSETVFSESKTASSPEGTRPAYKTGLLGFIDDKVAIIDYCNERIKELLPKLEEEQKNALVAKQQSAAVVLFNSKSVAALAAQTLHAQMFDTWNVTEAQEPREIIWTNLPKHFYERQLLQFVVYSAVHSTVFCMIPITAASRSCISLLGISLEESVHAAFIPRCLKPPTKHQDSEMFEDARSEVSR